MIDFVLVVVVPVSQLFGTDFVPAARNKWVSVTHTLFADLFKAFFFIFHKV